MKINWSQEVYAKTYRYATEAHNEQLFSGTNLPFIMHVSLVCMEVIAALGHHAGRDGNLTIQCALLHDVIEDTNITYEQIKEEFGLKVADGVMALTKNESLEKAHRIRDSLNRIREQPPEVWMVKLADRITNLAPPPHSWTREKKSAVSKGSLGDTCCT